MGKGNARLTANQEKFAQKYAECGNASEALRFAYPKSRKWKEGAVYSEASVMLHKPKVLERVRQIQEESRAASRLTREDLIDLCSKVINGGVFTDSSQKKQVRNPDGSTSTILVQRNISKTWAIDRLCKMCGYDNPIEVKVSKTKDRFESMTDDELKSEVERLRKLQSYE